MFSHSYFASPQILRIQRWQCCHRFNGPGKGFWKWNSSMFEIRSSKRDRILSYNTKICQLRSVCHGSCNYVRHTIIPIDQIFLREFMVRYRRNLFQKIFPWCFSCPIQVIHQDKWFQRIWFVKFSHQTFCKFQCGSLCSVSSLCCHSLNRQQLQVNITAFSGRILEERTSKYINHGQKRSQNISD